MAVAKRIRRPTSLDVARLAGVSQTTVSFVINGVTDAGIAEETRTRVLEAINQLDYHPHEAARNLRSRSSRILGMAIPETNSHLLEIAMGSEDYAESKKYGLFLSITDFLAEKEQRSLAWLQQQRYDGLLLMSRNKIVLQEDIYALRTKGYPITILGFHGPGIDSVLVDEKQGQEELLRHLIALGHRRIGYIYGVADQVLFSERLDSCLNMQQAIGIPIDERFIRRCGPTVNEGYAATLALMADCAAGERPTALIVVNDALATATLAALYTLGISVPAHMSVASFDNTPSSALTLPPLTTVDCEARVIGAEAARLTIERLQTPDRPPQSIYTHSKLVIRASTGPAPH